MHPTPVLCRMIFRPLLCFFVDPQRWCSKKRDSASKYARLPSWSKRRPELHHFWAKHFLSIRIAGSHVVSRNSKHIFNFVRVHYSCPSRPWICAENSVGLHECCSEVTWMADQSSRCTHYRGRRPFDRLNVSCTMLWNSFIVVIECCPTY